MQTFVPTDDFVTCARVLDRQRLGKQRVEGIQIMRTLLGLANGPKRQAAMRMWAGNEGALHHYVTVMCDEWVARGYDNTKCAEHLRQLHPLIPTTAWVLPEWVGDPEVHRSHRSRLLAKMPEHYRQFWPDEDDTLDYVWPRPLVRE